MPGTRHVHAGRPHTLIEDHQRFAHTRAYASAAMQNGAERQAAGAHAASRHCHSRQ